MKMWGPVKRSALVKMWGCVKKWNLEKKGIWGMKYFFWNCICNLKFSAVQHELPVGCRPPSFSQRDLGIKRTRSKRSQIEEWKKNSNLKSYLSHPKGMGKKPIQKSDFKTQNTARLDGRNKYQENPNYRPMMM